MTGETEIWKDIVGFENLYQISNKGRVFNLKVFRQSKLSNRGGYMRTVLFKNGKRKNCSVHRLVAEAFIPNPLNKPEINHINGNKNDNNVINLEWVTGKENINHAWNNGLIVPIKMTYEHKCKLKDANSIKVIDESTGIVYNSITDACIAHGYKISTLIHYLLGTRKNKSSLRYY